MVRWLQVDVVRCEKLPVTGDHQARVAISLTNSSGTQKQKSPWAPGYGADPSWSSEFGEIVDDPRFQVVDTRIAPAQGAGHRTGARVEFRVDSDGFGADDENYYDALRGGLTVSVTAKKFRTLDVLTKTKEVAATVISGSELIKASGQRTSYSLRDEKGNKAGSIVLSIRLMSDDSATANADRTVGGLPLVLEASPAHHKIGEDSNSSALIGAGIKTAPDSSSRDDDVGPGSAGVPGRSDANYLFDPFDAAPDPSSELRAQMAKISCPLCRQVFVDPVILGNCRHAMCRRCVWDQVGDGKQKLMTCPICSVSYNLGFAGTMGLTQARHVHPELRAAGFAQNCNKVAAAVAPAATSVLPPQMQSPVPQTFGQQPAAVQQLGEQFAATNPFGSAASADPDDVFARVNARAAAHERERHLLEAQHSQAQGRAEDVVKTEFMGMGSGWVKN